jgi:hypothetical protein
VLLALEADEQREDEGQNEARELRREVLKE